MKVRIILVLLPLVLGMVIGVLFRSAGRTREVRRGRLYRSSQPSVDHLESSLKSHGVRCVVNLRGEHEDLEWYREESDVLDRLGIDYITLEANAHELPSVRTVRTLLNLHESRPGPILVHCLSGRDRTGFACAFLEILDGNSLEKALRQLSWRYLHLCRKKECPLHQFFNLYETFLAKRNETHSVSSFRSWVRDVYVPQPYACRIELLEFPQRILPGGEVRASVKVLNVSEQSWIMHSDPKQGIRFGIRVLGPLESLPVEERELYFHRHRFEAKDLLRVGMTEDRWPAGEERTLSFQFLAPDIPGKYLYRLDMVDELVSWFYVRGYPALYVDVVVASSSGDPGGNTTQ